MRRGDMGSRGGVAANDMAARALRNGYRCVKRAPENEYGKQTTVS